MTPLAKVERHSYPPISSPRYPTPPIQFVPDPEKHPHPCNGNSADEQPSTAKTNTMQETVDKVIHNVIDPQDTQGSPSKNTFRIRSFSSKSPCARESKKKKQIWANKYVDFAMLLIAVSVMQRMSAILLS